VVVTGSRAEYGILSPLLEKIKRSHKLELKLIVTGMHLQKKYGLTVKEIESDGFNAYDVVHMYADKKIDHIFHARALGRAIERFASILFKIKPDILVVFGDRLEPLAATIAASTLKIPVAHIHGGDKTDSGHIDESIRHAISQFAHLHFSATKQHSKRLKRMGTESWRIFEVGALALDSIFRNKPISKKRLFSDLDINPKKKLIVCIFHPVHLETGTLGMQMKEIMKSIINLKVQTVIIYPNNDLGNEEIISIIKMFKKVPFVKIFPTIPHNKFINLLRYADILIGNSSSGIIESSTLKLPVINVGSRNTGREHAKNVLFVKSNRNDITKAIQICLYDKKFRSSVMKCKNPYGEGKTSDKILNILTNVNIDKKFYRKVMKY